MINAEQVKELAESRYNCTENLEYISSVPLSDTVLIHYRLTDKIEIKEAPKLVEDIRDSKTVLNSSDAQKRFITVELPYKVI